MLWRIFVIATVCLYGVSAVDQDLESSVLSQHFMPAELKEFLRQLKLRDVLVFKRIIDKNPSLELRSNKEIMQVIEQESPSLAKKLKSVLDVIHKKIEELGPEARDFATKFLEEDPEFTQKLRGGERMKPGMVLLHYMNEYARLSTEAKMDFSSKFPEVAAALSDPLLRIIIYASQ
ncbi:hypothetical protein OESDEN_00914 [Oesophagostomum dentatum]|uniref:Nematode fatty acid retinoid binding protein n=1 Tax=Oesophagostomum dentatum TaxID=61180 RepID=A0A0B1TUI1_OESDE|nr:hypothetical protein OESDEN_00914 [Oesophagostomum dentatum]